MTKEQKAFISLIESYLNDESAEINDDINLLEVYDIAKKQNIANFLYYAFLKNNMNTTAILNDHKKSLFQEAQQETEYNILRNSLVENQIRFMPIKGINIKHIYKNPDVRSMSDVDIIVDEESKNLLKPLLLDLGYYPDHSLEFHDVYKKNPAMTLEVHTTLVDDDNDLGNSIKEFFRGISDGQACDNGYEYKLSPEKEYIYMIAHSARHFYGAGIGVKNIIDVYQFNKFYNDRLDKQFIASQLRKMKLDKFENRLRHLSLVWFENEKCDENDEILSRFIFNGGAYGSREQLRVHEVIKNDENSVQTSKIKAFFKSVFPSFEYLSKQYTWLKKCPILLPCAWFARLCRIVFKRRQVISELNQKLDISEDDGKALSQLYKDMGLY